MKKKPKERIKNLPSHGKVRTARTRRAEKRRVTIIVKKTEELFNPFLRLPE